MPDRPVVPGDPAVDEKIIGECRELAAHAERVKELLASRAKNEGAQNLDARAIGKAKSAVLAAQSACLGSLSVLESYASDRHVQSPLRG